MDVTFDGPAEDIPFTLASALSLNSFFVPMRTTFNGQSPHRQQPSRLLGNSTRVAWVHGEKSPRMERQCQLVLYGVARTWTKTSIS